MEWRRRRMPTRTGLLNECTQASISVPAESANSPAAFAIRRVLENRTAQAFIQLNRVRLARESHSKDIGRTHMIHSLRIFKFAFVGFVLTSSLSAEEAVTNPPESSAAVERPANSDAPGQRNA